MRCKQTNDLYCCQYSLKEEICPPNINNNKLMLNLCKEFDKAKFPMNEMSQINSAQFKVEMGRSCVKNDAMFLFCTWTNY